MAMSKLYFQMCVSVVLLQGLAWCAANIALSSTYTAFKPLFGFLAALAICLSFLQMWIIVQRPSRHCTFFSLNEHIVLRFIEHLIHYRRFCRNFLSWKNPRYYQECKLQEIIKENGQTIYGRRFNLSDIQSLDEFRRRHPLTTYEHYRPYVERMMKGEENVLTKKTPTSFCRTTGTTGKPKFFPHSNRCGYMNQRFYDIHQFISVNYPCGLFQKTLIFYVHPIVTRNEHGARFETIGTDWPDAGKFLTSPSTPLAGFKINTAFEANYVQLLFGLRETDMGLIMVSFLSLLDTIFNQLKKNWEDIVHDIETGSINPRLQLPDTIRSDLSNALGRGDPERAAQLREEFQKGFAGILKRVWPRLSCISSMDPAGIWPEMQQTIAKGVSFRPSGYGCTECLMALHLGPKYNMDEKDFVPLPTAYVIEFIKFEDIDKAQPRTYFLDEVEVDQCYEVVVTQHWSGIYRYRMGDVLQITGFHDNCPTLRFMFRLGQVLNLHYEKMNQKTVHESVQAAVARWSGPSLVEYTVAESRLIPPESKGFDDSDVPYYLVFVELDDADNIPLTEENKNMVDEELRHRNTDYNRLRREGAIAEPRIYIVRSGAFAALKDFLVNLGATAVQYKSPRKLKSFAMVELMKKHAAAE